MQTSSLQRRRITGAHAFFLGALLALFALAPAILPYGGRFVTRGDFIEQQLPFILETRRILRGGLNSYSFNTFLGAPAVGSYAFYTLGSVFVWPLALLPKALIPFGISVMAVLKHAVCALTSFCYLRRMIRDERLALLGCVLYAFSGFTVVNTQFYHFTEVIAFFPLILLGMEDAMGEHPRRGLLALFCGLNTLTNYYFMLSSALLAALYFVFRFFSADWKPRRTWQNVFALIFECGVGCALAGVVLCPAMLFMLSITRTGAGDTSLLTQTYTLGTLLERIRALLMPIESNVVHAYYGDAPSWASTAAYLPVFGLTGVVALFGQKKHRWLKRVILTEGYMDVIALVQAGVPGVCATLGTALTLEQARLLKRYAPEIWVSYDGDAAGQHAILRALDIFEEEGVPARVLDFPGGMDPDEYIKTYGPQSVEQLRPTDATAYRMKQEAANHDLSTEEGRTAYAIACAKYLVKVKEPVELENYVKQLMVSTGFTREVLLAQIGRTELIEENKRPMFRHAARPLEEKNDGVDTETAAAEKGLLVLLAEGGIEPGTISADDFISPQRRALAQKLLDGLTPAAILEEMDDEEERSRTAKLLSSESGAGEQELRMVADYLRVLEKKRKENEIKALKEKMSTQQGEEKRGTLIKIQELLAQENKTGRRE